MLSIKLTRTIDWSGQDGKWITHIKLDTTLLPEWLHLGIYSSHSSENHTRIFPQNLGSTQGTAVQLIYNPFQFVRQTGPWLTRQTGPWLARQTGSWLVTQTGSWLVRQTWPVDSLVHFAGQEWGSKKASDAPLLSLLTVLFLYYDKRWDIRWNIAWAWGKSRGRSPRDFPRVSWLE